MIKLILLAGVSLALNIGTLFIDTTELSVENCPINSGCAGIELRNEGFPIQYVFEDVAETTTANEDFIVGDFNPVAFLANWLFWFGVTSLIWLSVTVVLKRFGQFAVGILLALYASGYLALLAGM